MELRSIERHASPLDPKCVRIRGEVVYDRDTDGVESIWFDAPVSLADELSDNGNPWLVCLAPLAATLGEPLRLCAPVDRRLFAGTQARIAIWNVWFGLPPVSIEADLFSDQPSDSSRVASMFSGGLDSFFTVLTNEPQAPTIYRVPVDELLMMWGFDIPIANEKEFRRKESNMRRAADELGKELVVVATNLRDTRWERTSWIEISHGCALASVALLLERRYRTVLIPSSIPYWSMSRWASHPLTDHLFSTARTSFVCDGGMYSRAEKLAMVAQSEVALRWLHVCPRSKTHENCGRCVKCLRTLIGLATLQRREAWPTFPHGLDLDAVRRLKLYTAFERRLMRRARELPIEHGRHDIVRAINRSIRRSLALLPSIWLLRGLKALRGMAQRALERFGNGSEGELPAMQARARAGAGSPSRRYR